MPSSKWVLSLLVIGAFLIVFHENVIDTVQRIFAPKDERTIIGKVSELSGSPQIKTPKDLNFISVKMDQSIRHSDTISTDSGSSAHIQFISGFEMQIKPDSSILYEYQIESGGVLATVLSGNFAILQKGKAGQLVVSKNQVFQDLSGREPLAPLTVTGDDTAEADPQNEPQTQSSGQPELSDAYIANVVGNQKPYFNRCYAQHLKDHPDTKGAIHLTFTIEPSGKVSTVNILNNSIPDVELQKCTVSVVERFRFREFSGNPIIINYPLQFE